MNNLRMIKVLLLTIAMTMSSNVMMGNPITVNDAKQKAQKFITSGKARRVKGNMNLSLAYAMNSHAPTTDDDAALYVFNVENENGFVIVSGDDVAVPILGYSSNGSFDENNIPSNLKAWLDNYVEEIAWAKNNASNTAKKELLTSNVSKRTIDALVPSLWDQSDPYSEQCVFNGKSYVTGCVATAMAQIMYYWAVKGVNGETFPCGSKALPSYTTNHGMTIDALDKVDSFDWENMINDLVDPSATPANKTAVAQLMRYCGQSIKTDYHYKGSAAYDSQVTQALIDCFGYNPDMSFINENMSTSAWKELVYNQLLNGKPVMLAAVSYGSEGHEFICDGYDVSTDKYHFNWGWGGNWDGWYEMSSLNPSIYDFSGAKTAIIDIMPLGQPLGVKEYAILSPDESTLTFYNDNLYDSRVGTFYEIKSIFRSEYWWETPPEKHQGWYGNENITDVVFDESFTKARPISTSHWFSQLRSLSNISNIEYLNTSHVNDMEAMFEGCFELTSIDLTHFNTSGVTNMAFMFATCINLEAIYLGNEWNWEIGEFVQSQFDVSNVTNMSGMFYDCNKLSYVDLGMFNTRKLTDMSYMFFGCYNLPLSGLGAFNTNNVTNMSYMFANCFRSNYYVDNGDFGYWDSRFLDLDLSFFDTSNVTDMSGMFADCDGLSSINLSSFNTSKVTNMYGMFSGCDGLTNIDLSNFDTSGVTDMGQMFSDCTNLTSLDIGSFDMSKISSTEATNMMFANCSGLESLKIPSGFNGYDPDACYGVGTYTSPCLIKAPDDFDFGVDTSGDYFKWKSGYFCLGKVELLLGDVNGDGAVNVSDVILVVNNILGIDSELFHFENADINADGKIDVSDAVGITNIILNSSPM